MWATSTKDIEEAISQGKIASMIGVESGHAIGSSLAILRCKNKISKGRLQKKNFEKKI